MVRERPLHPYRYLSFSSDGGNGLTSQPQRDNLQGITLQTAAPNTLEVAISLLPSYPLRNPPVLAAFKNAVSNQSHSEATSTRHNTFRHPNNT